MKLRVRFALLLVVLVVGIVPAAAQPAAECEEGYRLFDHEYLASDPVCIPENPQRIVALEMSALEAVLFSGKELVGTAGWLHEEVPVLIPEFADVLAEVADTGYYPANLEATLALAPDIILAVDGDIDVTTGSEIAPIVMPAPGIDQNWRQSMEFWSEVLGTQEQFAEMVATYDARIAEFKDALTDSPEVSIVGASSYGASLWLENTAPGAVVADAGLARPEAQRLSSEESLELYDEERWISLSDERLDLADGDAIFLFTYASTDPETAEMESEAIAAFQANPVWQSLAAAQAGRVYFVGPYWWRAQTYLLANKVLDDLFANLTETTAETPVLAWDAAAE